MQRKSHVGTIGKDSHLRTTKRASLGPAIVVVPQLGVVVDGREFLCTALLAVLPSRRRAAASLHELGCQLLVTRAEPLRLDEIALHAVHPVATVALPVEW